MTLPPEILLAQREMAASLLPEAPLQADGQNCLEMQRFEVAIAFNIDPPFRYAQDVLWLEVVACDYQSASLAARGWVLKSVSPFETTGFVRKAGRHDGSVGRNHRNEPLRVIWNAPVAIDTPPATVIRDPISGLRLGFLALPGAEERWLVPEAEGEFRLLTRKPTSSSDPAAVVPLCWRAV